MIYGNSTDPVLIKKISLKIWTLRDEIEAVISSRYKDSENKPNINDLIEEYKAKGSLAILEDGAGDDGEIKDAAELDDFGEDEMAKALAEAEAQEAAEANGEGEEEADSNSEENGEESEENQEEQADNILRLETAPEEKNGRLVIKQRTPMIPDNKVSHGRAILAEIYMDQMYFFSDTEFLVGQSIVLEFLVPKKFIMNATVAFCRTYNMKSRIISKNRLPFRVGINFSYLKDGERTVLRNFVKSIEPDVEEVAAKEEKKEESGGDEFDIFDDLDD